MITLKESLYTIKHLIDKNEDLICRYYARLNTSKFSTGFKTPQKIFKKQNSQIYSSLIQKSFSNEASRHIYQLHKRKEIHKCRLTMSCSAQDRVILRKMRRDQCQKQKTIAA